MGVSGRWTCLGDELSALLKNCCRGGTGFCKRMFAWMCSVSKWLREVSKGNTASLIETVLRNATCVATLSLTRLSPPRGWPPNVYSWCYSFSPFRFSAFHSGSDSSHNLNFSSPVRGASCVYLLFLSSAPLPGSLGMVNLIGVELALFEMFAVGKVRVLEWDWCLDVFRVEVIARGFQWKKSVMTCLSLSSETAVGKVCVRL